MQTDDLRGRLVSKQFASEKYQASICYWDRLIRAGKIKAVRLSPKELCSKVVDEQLMEAAYS
jgi:hypothetical protein